ncbi:MAG: preprotein translocase subunit YajC [Sedimentisphaerales bacterium]|nr:preprotein translocase subunit YajC [Phycisphaerales bacterium]HBR20202.1 preprotein translocase subunit YajC [Phycisphaerales bacterium]
MEVLGILAEANVPEVITADDISAESQQTTGTTIQTDPNGAAKPVVKNPKAQWQQFIFIGLIFVVMYFIMFRGPRKKQQQQKQMIMALKKNDRVQTIGGILGTVLEVSETEVVLKIDEANNTKLRVLPSAVSRVIEQK